MKINVRTVRGNRVSRIVHSIEAKSLEDAMRQDDEVREVIIGQLKKKSHFIPDITLQYEEADKNWDVDFLESVF